MSWFASLVTRLRSRDPARVDLAIGLLFALEGQVEVLFLDAPPAETLAVRALLAAGGLALIWRRRAPAASAIAVLASYMTAQTVEPQVTATVLLPFLAMFVAVYSLGRYAEERRLAPGLAGAAVVVLVPMAVDGVDDGAGSLVFTAFALLAAPAAIGRAIRQRAQLAATLRLRTEQLERERQSRAAAAVLDERTRIAGELHDVVAQALGAMVVQAHEARRLAEPEPARAGAAFAAVEATGRDALTEMRALLGVLRREDEGIALDPQPSLEHLSTLVRRAEAAGMDVHLAVEGERGALPAGVDLVAYRIVQEALGGAIDGGSAGSAEVAVRYAGDAVEVSVADDGHDPRGLLGVRERVTLYGGELVAGPRREGGHLVKARLPRADRP